MKEPSERSRSEVRRMQREQERERRRIRDRQRRQSMTVEQRERHLARRRRNYQLRRLRAENAKVTDFESKQDEAVTQQGLDAVPCKPCGFSVKRLRLSHVRRLARSRSGTEVIAKTDANNNNTSSFQVGDFGSRRLPNGLRLNRVKRLARAINTAPSQASVNGHRGIENISLDRNHSQEETKGISNDSCNLDKVIFAEANLKDLTWTDQQPSWANVEGNP